MSSSFKKGKGNWVEYRKLPKVLEVDFHLADPFTPHDFRESMQRAYADTLRALQRAQEEGNSYVLFTHGHSTSRRGKTSCRSQVRAAVRSKEATPFVIRGECIQHESVFVAAIRPIPAERESR